MVQKQRAGLFIQNIGNAGKLLDSLERMRPSHIVVLNNAGFLKEALERVPEIEYGALRFYSEGSNDEGQLWRHGDKSIDNLLKNWRKTGLNTHPRACLVVGNEPVETGENLKRLVNWQTRAAELANGDRLMLWNAGSATFGKTTPDILASGVLDPLFQVCHENKNIFFSTHEYSGPMPPICAAGKYDYYMMSSVECQPNKWPGPYDVQVTGVRNHSNWLIGRVHEYLQYARSKTWTNVQALIGEAGPEQVAIYKSPRDFYEEIGAKHGRQQSLNGKWSKRKMPLPHWNWGGANCYRWYWEDTFKDTWGVPPEQVFARTWLEFMKWWMFVYDGYDFVTTPGSESVTPNGNPMIKGTAFYLHSPGKSDWDTERGSSFHEDELVYQFWGDWGQELKVAPDIGAPAPDPDPPVIVLPAPVPKPAQPGQPTRAWVNHPEKLNVRDCPSVNCTDIGDLFLGDIVDWYPETKVEDTEKAYFWVWVEKFDNSAKGWVALVKNPNLLFVPQILNDAPLKISIATVADVLSHLQAITINMQQINDLLAKTIKDQGFEIVN